MKFLILLNIWIVILIANAHAQRCPVARPTRCEGPRNEGARCILNPPHRMWYYDPARRACLPMNYLGCDGNSNRWCKKSTCEAFCL